ncbi:isochorismate synthase [Psychromonas sp. psych-6C06]|uniref:isochorismate synthase n=1 Tax=Psychromonas sp. psych-6C06 TaxID=2058089 RepID=UPI000C34ECC0|nr:isochorismate synthase [Psychromonas sp. psych-6C06]PKF61654.1 isochorismate synthase [Psychromonas sp. psych-6C06]
MIEKISDKLRQLRQRVGEYPTKNLNITLEPLSLLAFLKAQKEITPAIFWQDKAHQRRVVCLGAIDDINHIPEINDEARYYGGLAFQQQGKQWQNFPAVRFIRPALEFSEENSVLTLICHFDGNTSIETTLLLLATLRPSAPLNNISTQITSRNDSPNQQHWAELVDLAIEYKALLPKVVLSRQTELICETQLDYCDLLAQWHEANPNSFLFSFKFAKDNVFIGCSPERLFERSDNKLQTEALAGTVNRGRNEREDNILLQSLLTDKKIDRENYLVQEFIIANLKRLKAQVSCEEPHVLQLHNVQHLCVPIHAQLPPETSDAELLYRLHPTPAVGGSPKLPALQFINDNEPYLRGWYAGAVGHLSANHSDFSVAIRSALLTEKRIKLFAGAGIVTGSIAEQEWQELDNKIHTILDIITLKGEQ